MSQQHTELESILCWCRR